MLEELNEAQDEEPKEKIFFSFKFSFYICEITSFPRAFWVASYSAYLTFSSRQISKDSIIPSA